RGQRLGDEGYRCTWWAHTRALLAEYAAADRSRDPVAPGPLIARVVLASPAPRDLPRLRGLAARPARLTPPYARARDGAPCWSDDLPGLTLEALLTRPTARLPLAVDAELRPRARRLRLRLHDLYGRTAQAGPVEAEVEWRHRDG